MNRLPPASGEREGQGSESDTSDGKDYPFGYRGGFDLPIRRPPDERLIERLIRAVIRERQARIHRQLERAYFSQFYEEDI